MKTKTEIDIRPAEAGLTPGAGSVMLGSCFTDYVGQRLAAEGWEICANPCGTLFNPFSISRAIRLALSAETLADGDFFLFESAVESGWRCWDFPTKFSAETPESCREKCEAALTLLRGKLTKAQSLILTFGTAWVFELAAHPGRVVANCHKVPAREFRRRRATVEEIVATWEETIKFIRTINPGIRIILTVSPVRHLKDGFHGNACSKATLLLACEELCATAGCEYFPSFEIMTDDLRDYRYYAEDLVHPSPEAIDYIFKKFICRFQ